MDTLSNHTIAAHAKPLRIGIVAGEPSGDILGANLITALQQLHPNLIIEGIGGPQMIAAGCKSLFPIEPLSVTGITEVLSRLRQILAIRKGLLKYFRNNPPDVFIGVDAPDFNLPVELQLRKINIPTTHYNSPTVWAWRKRRIFKIAQATNLMLTLFPFEAAFYHQHHIPVEFVGHPLADMIAEPLPQTAARDKLALPRDKKIIALLPGSRANEINLLAEPFLHTAQLCLKQIPDLQFAIPFINNKRREQFLAIKADTAPELPIVIFDGQSREVMAAADAILLASGTATLEGLLVRRPMVVAYKLSAFTYAIVKRLVSVPYISLPNLLANKPLIPEFIQSDVTPENLSNALLKQLSQPAESAKIMHEFAKIHSELKGNASLKAAQAVLRLITHKDG